MLDKAILDKTRGLQIAAAQRLLQRNITADTVTIIGFCVGMLALPLLALGLPLWALLCIVLNRICDGLDGTVARLTKPTNKGAFLDIALDFLFYSFIPLSFAIYNPDWALASAFLIFTFIGTGSSFLAYATIAEKTGIDPSFKGKKSIYYLGGLTEGTETITFLCALCIWPQYFSVMAGVFSLLCLFTIAIRIYRGWIDFS